MPIHENNAMRTGPYRQTAELIQRLKQTRIHAIAIAFSYINVISQMIDLLRLV